MKLKLSNNLCYCMGVDAAIKKMLELTENKSDKSIYMLGEIVHNRDVVNMLCGRGVIFADDIEDIPDGNILAIRAHGTVPHVYERAKEKNLELVDTTCKIVVANQKKVKLMESKGYTVVIIGDKKHDEVKSIASFADAPIVVHSAEDVYNCRDKLRRIYLITQTTEIIDNICSLVGEIAKYSMEIHFENTTCKPSRERQQEVIELALNSEAVLIVGSKTSKNTKNLYDLAKKYNHNSYWVENKSQIDMSKIGGVNELAIAAGTSTPQFIIDEITEMLSRKA